MNLFDLGSYLVFVDLVEFHFGSIIPFAVAIHLVQFQGMFVVAWIRYPNCYVADLLACLILVWLIALVRVFWCLAMCLSLFHSGRCNSLC